MKKIFVTCLCMLLCMYAFVSCEDKGKDTGSEYDPSKPVKLTAFFPDSGRIAEKVILEGENFGINPADIKVYFNKKQAKVIGSTGSSMYVVVPRTPGDTCDVSVVVGKDSVVYAQTFLYKISVTVSTIAGNGTNEFKEGTLTTATLRARYLCVDNDNNIFAVQRENGTDGLIRVNEEENVVTLVQSGLRAPNALCVDKVNGIVTVPSDEPTPVFYNSDPKEGWGVRTRNMRFTDDTEVRIGNSSGRYKHSMAACEWDGYIYTRFRSGDIVKTNPKTYESETVYTTTFGDSYGVAFHPLHPELLYVAMGSECGENAHSICVLDVSNPKNSFRQLSAPNRNGGFRDGKLENAQFRYPCQIYFDPEGYLYIADRDNHCIRRMTPDNMVETIIGIPETSGFKDGNRDEALFNRPWGLGVGSDGTVYIADYDNARIRKLAVE